MFTTLYDSLLDIHGFFKKSQNDLNVLTNPVVKYKVYHPEVVLCSFSIHILSLAMPVIVLQVYDRIISYQNYGTLYSLFIALAVSILLEFILKTTRSYVLNYYSSALEHSFYMNTINKLIRSNFKREGKNIQTSSYVQKVEEINKLKDIHCGNTYLSFIEIPFMFIYLTFIVYLCGIISIIPVAISAVALSVCLKKSKDLIAIIKEKNTLNKNRFHFIYESLDGIHTIKSLGSEHTIVNRYEDTISQVSKLNYKESLVRNSLQNTFSLSSNLMTILIAAFGAFMAIEGELSSGTLITSIILSNRLVQPLQRYINLWISVQTLKPYQDSLKSIFNAQNESTLIDEELTDNNKKGRIVIEDLQFRYRSNLPNVLKGININLYNGDSIAITGKLDAGKNTLIKLISGTLKPSKGNIKVNGFDPSGFDSKQLIENMAILPEQGTIYSGTIRDNLTNFGEVPFEQSLTILKYLGLNDEINRLPMGYDTVLQGGVSDGIPPGLKQRIAIARSLNYKPKIIVFNNADRHLDSVGYSHLIKLLGKIKKKVILIMITDDHNLISLADTVYELKAGELFIDETYTNLNYRLDARRKELAV